LPKIFENPTTNEIKMAADVIKSGGLVVFPTETVYGLGANGLSCKSARKIYEAKGRPSDNPLILHISDFSQLNEIVLEIPDDFIKLKKFMPGPLTIIMKKTSKVPSEVTAGLDTVAVRMPRNEVALELIRCAGLPIAAPSANISGRPSPTILQHVVEDFGENELVDIILDSGKCDVGLESTILDLSGKVPAILREGEVTVEELERALRKVVKTNKEIMGTPRAPGMKYIHYAPKAPLYVCENLRKEIEGNPDKKIGVLTTTENNICSNENIISIFLGQTPEEFAANLYEKLREFNKYDLDLILAPEIYGDGICAAVRNRLYKASQNRDI